MDDDESSYNDDDNDEELLEHKIIRESSSSVSSSIVLRPNLDGTLRMCANYTKLNNLTVKDRYPIPYINEIWNQIKSSQIYTKLDMISGYYQIPIGESDKYLTTFAAPQGLFEYNDHVNHLENIFKKMKENNLLVKLSKCQFFQKQIRFLGHIINRKGIQIDYDRLEPLVKILDPTNIKEVQRLIGTLNYFRKFVGNFASKIEPIYQLLKDESNFEWTNNYKTICLNIIDELKANKTILVYPNPKEMFMLETDASDIGIGAILSQKHELFQECLSVICALEEFHYIIGTQEVEVVTDNIAVSFLKNDKGKIKNKRLINQNIKLASYNITLKYRSGKENVLADALSRCPVERIFNVIPLYKPHLEESKTHGHGLVASRVAVEAPFYSVIDKTLFRLIVNPTKRPITLLNVDYKLYSKIINNRLVKILSKVVSIYQTGFVPKRLIHNNIITLDMVIKRIKREIKKDKNPNPIVTFYDFEKAFDSISHEAIQRTLEHIRIPSTHAGGYRVINETYLPLIITKFHQVARVKGPGNFYYQDPFDKIIHLVYFTATKPDQFLNLELFNAIKNQTSYIYVL
ncbi:hypothetical protein ACTA71_004805 [Dictyostelium dimigraforme]